MSNRIKNVEAILAVDMNFGLAKEGKIPWKSKKDLNFFREKTINNVVIMGAKTLLSLPNSMPLKNRINIVLTNNYEKYSKTYEKYDNIYFVNFNHVVNLIKYCYKDKTIFIIGGSQIYELMLPFCSTIWLTKIKTDYECDLIFNCEISHLTKQIVYEDDDLEIMQLN